jgi:hypothetical protein
MARTGAGNTTEKSRKKIKIVLFLLNNMNSLMD